MRMRLGLPWSSRLGMVGVLLGCGASSNGRPAGDNAERELREVAEVIINDNFAANRIDPIEPYIADEVAVLGPAGGTVRIGKAPMLESLRRSAAEKTTLRWEERDWHIQVYDRIGIVSFLYEHEGTRGGQAYNRSQRATYVFHRSGDRWLLVHDHTSANPAPAGS